MRSKRF